MPLTTLKLVTIVAEPVLEPRLLKELRSLGARGWTIVEGRGEGSLGRRTGDIPGVNVRIETVVSPVVAERIVARLAESYFADYAVVAWVEDVGVVRGEKYV
jgi:hypothetical protein